jgi:hypothetical protein
MVCLCSGINKGRQGTIGYEWCYLSRKLLSQEDHEKVLANQRLSCPETMGGDGCNIGNVFSSYTVVKFSLYYLLL